MPNDSIAIIDKTNVFTIDRLLGKELNKAVVSTLLSKNHIIVNIQVLAYYEFVK